jgi:tellurite resistance protein TerC
MNRTVLTYVVFGVVLLLALVFDLGLLSKKNKTVTIKAAAIQTAFWVVLAMAFFGFLWVEDGHEIALTYLSAYLMEWSLSIDNIFVFILIFSSLRIKEQYYGRVLLIGILMAIVFRVIFITVGVALVQQFSWLLYLFGLFLLYTGIKMFAKKEEEEAFNPERSKMYKFLQRFFPITYHDGGGKFTVTENGRKYYTLIFLTVMMLAGIDLVFALDSIPAVMGIAKIDNKVNNLVVYTSNIFAVLGLRSLFFLLRGAANRFEYLQQGIAIVLVFIGLKMLAEHWVHQWFSASQQTLLSLGVILLCLGGSIVFSIYKKRIDLSDKEPSHIQ